MRRVMGLAKFSSILPSDVFAEGPAGVKSGMEIRLPGHGRAGVRGGKRGHLFVTVKVKPHAHFRHLEDDLHVEVAITLKEMLLGGAKQIPTLDGLTEVVLAGEGKMAACSSKVLRGRGPPRVSNNAAVSDAGARGNLIAHFRLQLPKKLSGPQVGLILEFDRLEKSQT